MQTSSFTVILERELPAAAIETTLAELHRRCVRHLSLPLAVRLPTDIGANGQILVFPERSTQSVCEQPVVSDEVASD